LLRPERKELRVEQWSVKMKEKKVSQKDQPPSVSGVSLPPVPA
jgi:hypothetical protein